MWFSCDRYVGIQVGNASGYEWNSAISAENGAYIMGDWVNVAEVWRGAFLESVHQGRAVVCDSAGQVIAEWGDISGGVLPRSSCKMIQALPLVESGAAARFGLTTEQLALSCASHQAAAIHVDRVTRWLAGLELGEPDLRCGPQVPRDPEVNAELIKCGCGPDKRHNNCSGKHSGFLTLNKHLGGGSEYVQPDHPVQKAVLAAYEEMTAETSPGHAIDHCSAPNFATSLKGLATAMAQMADPSRQGETRRAAVGQLVAAMKQHPDLVAGEGRACTELMRAMPGPTVVKTGAEGVFAAILPERGLGVAVKARDGATRAAENMMAAILVRLGVAEAAHPMVVKRLTPVIRNFAGIEVGKIQPDAAFYADGARI